MNIKLKKQLLILFFALCSILLSVSFLGAENLRFDKIDWLLGNGDASNAQNGWTFFKNDKWHFPLGKNPNYGLEISSSIIFSDSIPLFAFIFKIFKNFLSENFQYFSLWIFSCFFLQFYFSYLIIYKITNNSYYSLVSGIFFIISPIFIYRLGYHMSLAGQWLILIGFYINFFINKDRKKRIWIFLLILSTLIHLYFTAMLFIMYASFIFESFLRDKKIKDFIRNLFSPLIIVLIFMYIFGYFESKPMDTVSRGYGDFGLDLLGVFDPQVDEATLNWSFFINNIKGTSYEGFNYLGLGCIILLFISLIIYVINIKKNKNYLLETLNNNLGILLIIIILTAWAVTTNIYFRGQEIFTLPLHNYVFGILSIFAATGRFFWPVYYLLIILSLICLYKNFKNKHASVIITLILLIQIVDITPGLSNYFIYKNNIGKPKIHGDKIWQQIPHDYEKFRTTYLFNNYGPIFASLNHFLGTSKIKKTDIVLSIGFDRSKAASIRYDLYNAIYNKNLPNDTAYVIDNLGHLKQMKFFLKNTNDGFFYRDKHWLVLPDKKAEMTVEDIKKLSKVKFYDINIDQKYEFHFSEREKLLGVGWSHNYGGESGVWSEGEISFILFSIQNAKNENLKLKLNLKPYKSNKNKNFKVELYFNNILKKTVNLNNFEEKDYISLDIIKNELKSENIVMFKFYELISPYDIFESPDGRKLGILLKTMLVEKAK